MSSIKVYEVSGDTRPLNAISVWDSSSTGTRPLNSIPVWKDTNNGDRPLNSIQVKIVDKALNAIPVWFNGSSEPGPGPGPEPSLPPYTLRLKFTDMVIPSFSKGTATQVSSSPNIWDLTYVNTDWGDLLYNQGALLEVIDGNTTGVTNMTGMFRNCNSLTSVPLFDTSNVTEMFNMFRNCNSLITVPLFNTYKVTSMNSMFEACLNLSTIPLFDTSNVTDMDYMFYSCDYLKSVPLFDTSKVTHMDGMLCGCINVQYGALALYTQASTQTNPPFYHNNTFHMCGDLTETGHAELEQIPESWGGKKSGA